MEVKMIRGERIYNGKANQTNRWRGFVLGCMGGAAGVWAMNAFMARSSDLFQKIPGDRLAGKQRSISLVGRQHQEGESSTAALGRMLYHRATGEDPKSDDLKKTLGNMVHWGYGITMGGVWGASRFRPAGLQRGAVYGSALWLGGDEVAVPLLGLSSAPSAHPPSEHLQTLAAHCVYGAVTAAATGLLKRAFGESNGSEAGRQLGRQR
jgi:hypothetical protein